MSMGRAVGPARLPRAPLTIKLTRSDFTFPLEQKKSYSVGRRAEKDVQFLSKRVRMDEGRLEIGDWDPSNVRDPAVGTQCGISRHGSS